MLATALNKSNSWWQNNTVIFDYTTSARSELKQLIEACTQRRITAVLGARRVGKSTLLLQTIAHLLQTGVDNKRILYFSGDTPTLRAYSTSQIIDYYLTEVLNEADSALTNRVYIFIDEVHVLDDWQLHLKDYYDRRVTIKFFVSGSSAAHIMLHSKESLQGRIERQVIFPLRFSQYARMQVAAHSTETSLDEFFSTSIDWLDPHSSAMQYSSTYNMLLGLCEPAVNSLINRYLICGGYPELLAYDNDRQWLHHLGEDIVYAALFKDIINIFNIKNPEILERLLYAIADHSGQGFSYTSLGETVGLDRLTASIYADYLQKSFLINISEPYSTNVAKTIRKNKKLYISDCGIRNALLREYTLTDKSRGLLAEGAVYNALKQFADNNFATVGYWREGKQEVDAVLNLGNKLIPIEVKFRNKFTDSDLGGLHAFMREFDCQYGIVITKNQLSIKDKVVYVPFWMV
ncbi:MAG: ATP-binding protein [Bacillota bacterium]